MAGIPVFMVHGRLDISGPVDIPLRLAHVLPSSELVVIGEDGHGGGGGGSTLDVIVGWTDRLAP